MNIFEKMQQAKEMILKANLKKSGKNNFAGYTYYELADLLPTIVQVCNNLKLFTKVTFTDEYAILEIINIEKPEEMIQYTSPMKELSLKGANAIQSLGGVETYQRRYLYMSAFDIIENDMFDGAPPNLNVEEKPNVMQELNEAIKEYAKKVNQDEKVVKKALLEKIGVKTAKDLTEEKAKMLLAKLK